MDWKQLLLTHEGRISRQPYWIGTLALVAAVIVVQLVASAVLGETLGGILGVVVQLAILYPAICVSIKRWHDRNKSGWWVLIGLIPIIGGIWTLVECGILAGTSGANDYGADPLASA
jgi:uncharacterized membrane protein YhaH (DUF805 family)